MINDFWHTRHLKKIPNKHQKLKVVSAIGMFYDLEDPSKFIKHAADALDDDGIFVAQLMCSHSMFKTNDLGNICHEHLEYYSYNSLKYLFEKNGLKIFKMSENKINGGSYRIYCKKNIKKSIKYKEQASYSEIIKFIKRVKQNKQSTVKFIKNNIKLGKKIFLYGASTKGNTLLQYYNLTNREIPFAAERTKTKWGKYTIGSGVKILSEEDARNLNPDYFFVMPYGFIKEFIKREKKWLRSGGKFILPYPKFKVLKTKDHLTTCGANYSRLKKILCNFKNDSYTFEILNNNRKSLAEFIVISRTPHTLSIEAKFKNNDLNLINTLKDLDTNL